MLEGKSADVGKSGVVSFTATGDSMGVVLPSGLTIRYPNLRKIVDKETGNENRVYDSREGQTYIYGAKAVENIVQGLARCIIGEQMLKIAKRYRVLLTVHDAVCVLVGEDDIVSGRAFVEECMRWTPDWAEGLPLDCESGVGKNYGDCK